MQIWVLVYRLNSLKIDKKLYKKYIHKQYLSIDKILIITQCKSNLSLKIHKFVIEKKIIILIKINLKLRFDYFFISYNTVKLYSPFNNCNIIR